MRKKIFIIMGGLCIFFLHRHVYNSQEIDCFLDNIEALGSGEDDHGGCAPGGSYKCGGASGYRLYT